MGALGQFIDELKSKNVEDMEDHQLYNYLESLVYTDPLLAEKIQAYLNTAFMELDKRLDKLVPEQIDE